MAQSRAYKKGMNFVYGIGAAVVIIGALFKIQHINIGPITGGLMLTIGLIAEAIVFLISAFDAPEEDLDWSKVYPELAEGGISSKKETKKLGAEGMLSQKLDSLLQEAKIDSNLMASLGSSMKNFQNAAEGLSAASGSVASTNKYNEEMSKAALQMESLNNLYKVQVENTSKQAELNTSVVENTERLHEQMKALASNLSSLNGVYGNMLSAMSNK
ncbi:MULTISPECIES: gliding motility protein GldL [Polaribacter]|uniref:Gliding motility protein GldL n=1 Tax=Polaribacter marinaquae TaxID=1642819 RepID=A0ABZ2TVG2_9FLAO|nr:MULTISPECIES: gliding motility protein GldL [unclassified Polaribacter]AQS94933.1 gliding motility protein GldL [Polaribacter sp. BM10]SHM98124.1 protein involved in gliding motility GldL [Polaribacter sp. KT 15]